MAAALLEFLQVEAEEFSSNFKIQVHNDFGREGPKTEKRGQQVIGLLSMYVQAPGKLSFTSYALMLLLTDFLRRQVLRHNFTTNALQLSVLGYGQDNFDRAG